MAYDWGDYINVPLSNTAPQASYIYNNTNTVLFERWSYAEAAQAFVDSIESRDKQIDPREYWESFKTK